MVGRSEAALAGKESGPEGRGGASKRTVRGCWLERSPAPLVPGHDEAALRQLPLQFGAATHWAQANGTRTEGM